MMTVQEERFLAELETFMRDVKKLSESSIRVYLHKIRKLLDSGYSVDELFGEADRLWSAYRADGQLYDAKDHGNTRAAVRHVADLARKKLLEEFDCLYVSYDAGWNSFREKGKYESGYVIQNGVITFSFNIGFEKGKDVAKKISTKNLRKLIYLFESAYKRGCLASSDTCLSTVHGKVNKYDYSFADVEGNNCSCLFEGDSAYVKQLNTQYFDLLEELRS